MAYTPFSFTSGQAQPDPTAQAGLAQYQQQGQGGINPGVNPAMQGSPPAALGAALQQILQQQNQRPAVQGAPSQGPNAPMGNLPIAPGQYQSPQALDNATGQLYPSPYAAQQSQGWLGRLFSGSGS